MKHSSKNQYPQDDETNSSGFNMRDHLDKLTPVEGKPEGEYYCPLCGTENFKVDLDTGEYRAFECGCSYTEEGKRQIRNKVAPLEKSPRQSTRQNKPRKPHKSTNQKNRAAQLKAAEVEVQVDHLLVMVKEELQTYEESLVELTEWCQEHGHNKFAASQLFKERAKSNGLNPGKKTAGDILLEIALKECTLFHTPDKDAFADVVINGVRQTLPVRRKPFRQWLSRRYFESEKKAVGSQTMQDTLGLLEAIAVFNGDQRDVQLRLAEQDGNLYLDLGRDDWTAIEIRTDGWTLIPSQQCPVRFLRPDTQLALPIPEHGGHVSELRNLLNVEDDAWVLILAWLLFCFYPKYPHPVLILHGEQGSGKSSLARLLKSLVDPSKSPLIPAISDLRQQAITLSRRWVVVYDNLSGISAGQSDAICRTSTGAGFTTRTLYENDEETVFEFIRPQLLTGIDSLATRGDLLERSILVNLKPIPTDSRIGEADLEKHLDANRPRLLGALLTAVSQTLAALPNVKPERLPRMADFARFAIAAEPAMGVSTGAFMTALASNSEEHHEIALESSPLGTAIQRLMEGRGRWQGISTELLDELSNLMDEKTVKSRHWPGDATRLSRELGRLAPDLRGCGIDWFKGEGKNRRQHNLEKINSVASSASPVSPTSQNPDETKL
jgi:energy-coupling factor transporter ATP-binding protein EcfA2